MSPVTQHHARFATTPRPPSTVVFKPMTYACSLGFGGSGLSYVLLGTPALSDAALFSLSQPQLRRAFCSVQWRHLWSFAEQESAAWRSSPNCVSDEQIAGEQGSRLYLVFSGSWVERETGRQGNRDHAGFSIFRSTQPSIGCTGRQRTPLEEVPTYPAEEEEANGDPTEIAPDDARHSIFEAEQDIAFAHRRHRNGHPP